MPSRTPKETRSASCATWSLTPQLGCPGLRRIRACGHCPQRAARRPRRGRAVSDLLRHRVRHRGHHRAGCHQHGPDRVYGLRSGPPAPSLPALHDRPRGQLGRAVVHHPTTGSGLARRPPSRLTQTSYARNSQPHPWRSHGLCSGHPPSCRHHMSRIHTHSLPILAPCMWLLATCRWST